MQAGQAIGCFTNKPIGFVLYEKDGKELKMGKKVR